MLRYVWRDLVRNPLRTLVSMLGVTLGTGLFSALLFFNDGSSASLTRRALEPLTLDIQRVLTAPLGRSLTLSERIEPAGPVAAGGDVTVQLTVVNRGIAPAHEVVINDEPPPPLTYLQGTTTLNGQAIADVVGQSPLAQGLARTGLNVGTVPTGGSVTLGYTARANTPIDDVAALDRRATISSREEVVPVAADSAEPMTIDRLVDAIAAIPGVAAADALSFVDLPAGSLSAGTVVVDRPVRLFAMAARYPQHYPTIRLTAGAWDSRSAVLSVEAARRLGAHPGSSVTLSLPGGATPASLPVSGVADLARATPLFASRKSSKLEDFLYVADSIIIDSETFAAVVAPAFRTAQSTTGSVPRSTPVSEVDVLVDRSRLPTDPGRALTRTTRLAAMITAIAPGQDYLIDNISNALGVARSDAAVGKRMFVFLGLPGVIIGAYLTVYAGRVLATTQRRDHANLRVRGAQPRHLRRLIAWRTVLLAGGGSILGILLGAAATLGVVGRDTLLAAQAGDLLRSSAIAIGGGVACTGLALYLAGRRWNRQQIGDERREIVLEAVPAWRRRRLDLMLIAAAAVIQLVAVRRGALHPPRTSVSLGESPSLPLVLLAAPVVAWLGGTLAGVRLVHAAVARAPIKATAGFGPPVRGLMTRSLRRRSWAIGTGTVGVALVGAFGAGLLVFAATYDAAKAADARFVVGGDIRITPSVLADAPPTVGDVSVFDVRGVRRVSPVIFQLENAVLIGRHDQDRADLAAIDPAGFADIAPLSDSLFVGASAADSMTALGADPRGVLVETTLAEGLSISDGDLVKIVVARGTDRQAVAEFTVVGRFTRLPGFPQGVGLVVDLATYAQLTGLERADFFIAGIGRRSHDDLARAVAELETGPGSTTPIHVDSTADAIDKDRSSLTAFDLRGLLHLDLLFGGLMGIIGVAIFVLALMLARRREYVLLRAHGLAPGELRRLVIGEAMIVAVGGVVTGLAVGVGVGYLLVDGLRPLFELRPLVVVPLGRLALLGVIPLLAAPAASLWATAVLARIDPGELLRES